MEWTIDRHKYLSEVSRTALQIIKQHKITSKSSASSQHAAEDEMADAGVYRTKQSAYGRISRALFTYFRSYGCIDGVESLTETGSLFASGDLSVKEFALHYMMNYEHSGVLPLMLILELLLKLAQEDPGNAFIVAEDISDLSEECEVSEGFVQKIISRHKKGLDVSPGTDGSDVWMWLLRQTGLLLKRKDKTCALLNQCLAEKLLGIYKANSVKCQKGLLIAGALECLPLPKVQANGFKCNSATVFSALVRVYLFDGPSDETCVQYLPPDSVLSVDEALSAMGLSPDSRGIYSGYIGFERLVGHRLVAVENEILQEIGKALLSAEAPIVREVEIPENDGVMPEPPINQSRDDRLSIALKLFAEQRATWRAAMDKNKGPTYQFVNADVRAFFGKKENWDVEKLKGAEGFEDFCLHHTWMLSNGKAWPSLSHYDDAERAKLVDWIDEKIVKGNAALQNIIVDDNGLKGFTNKAVSELLMKFHPESYILCNGPTIDSLKFLRSEWTVKENYSYADYLKVLGAAAVIRDCMAEMKIYATLDGTTPPDFLAVNEFIFFVSENKDLIKEKVMEKSYKNALKAPKTGKRSLKNSVQNDEMMQRLMAALRTKPFAILAGHSGTGKSQLVRRLAYMTCNDEELLKEKEKFNAPGNYCMVQVKPNWHDSTDLLGYYTEMNGGRYHTTPFVEFICKAYAYPETPFFVCLDEMNLAPVEQYFAEFLSAIESYSEKTGLTDRLITEKADADEICGQTKLTESLNEVKKHGLTIPRNLFVVGTVNVDETTCQFSRKVLDRAMTILMNEVKFGTMTAPNDPSQEDLLDESGINFFLERPTQSALDNGQMKWLDKIQNEVGPTSFAIAYRFANEYALYQAAYQKLLEIGLDSNKEPIASDATAQKTAIDHVVLMKLLPRIHGTSDEVERLFKGQESDPKREGLVKVLGDGQSVATMKRILERRSDYLTFWP